MNDKERRQTIAVLGAGSWGTALAIQLARSNHPTHLWGRDARHIADIQRERVNRRYLPDTALPSAVTVFPRMADAVQGVRDVLIAVPSHAFRKVLEELRPLLTPDMRVAWATKGFELGSGR